MNAKIESEALDLIDREIREQHTNSGLAANRYLGAKAALKLARSRLRTALEGHDPGEMILAVGVLAYINGYLRGGTEL